MFKKIGAVVALSLCVGPANAGNIYHNACVKSGRPAATRDLCACIQRVADRYFKAKEQRLAASFFKDPHKAQEIRQSDRQSHEVFWTRYKAFGAAAEETCKPS